MSDKRSAWFQIHLSTAIVLMLVAGGFLWANIQVNNFAELKNIDEESRVANEKFSKSDYLVYPFSWAQLSTSRNFGWPATAYIAGNDHFVKPEWHWHGVLVNISCALGILWSLALFLERREARKP